MTFLIIYFLLAIIVSFLCSLLEACLLSIPITHVVVLEKEGKKSGKILKELKSNINKPLAAILTINTIANTVGAAGVGAQVSILYGNNWVALASGTLTLCILIISEIIPKTIGSIYNKSLAPFTALTVKMLMGLVWPFVLISESMSKLIGKNNPGVNLQASREELLAMAEMSEDEGSIDEQEGDIIENLIKLDNITVEEVMTPKSVIFALNKNDTVGKVIKKHSPLEFSRIPVYKETLENPIGIVNRYNLVNKQAQDKFDVKISELIKPIFFVLDTDSVSDTLDRFVKRRQQMFIVKDEFGTITGLITLEDAIETLLGVEIVDEHDNVVDMRKLAKAKMKENSK